MAELAWDPRLMTPARALELAGKHRLYATFELAELSQFEPDGYAAAQAGPDGRLPDQWQVNLRCETDNQSVGLLATPREAFSTSIEDLLSGVLRHLVMAHGVSLSGVRSEPGPCAGPDCDHVSHQSGDGNGGQ